MQSQSSELRSTCNTPSLQVVESRKTIGRAFSLRGSVPVLEITKERIARTWDRGVTIRQIARMFEMTTADVDAVLFEKRARTTLPPVRSAA